MSNTTSDIVHKELLASNDATLFARELTFVKLLVTLYTMLSMYLLKAKSSAGERSIGVSEEALSFTMSGILFGTRSSNQKFSDTVKLNQTLKKGNYFCDPFLFFVVFFFAKREVTRLLSLSTDNGGSRSPDLDGKREANKFRGVNFPWKSCQLRDEK